MSGPEKHLQQGTKGLAGRVLNQSTIGPATTRSALQRVAAKTRRAGPATDAEPAKKSEPANKGANNTRRAAKGTGRAACAAQAALSMMGRKPADFDDDSLRTWLKAMSAEDLKKLSKLVWAARQDNQTAPQSTENKPFEKVVRQLESQGMQFSINANTVVINVGESAAKRPPYQPSLRRKDFHGDWGRSWGRVKDFINGH